MGCTSSSAANEVKSPVQSPDTLPQRINKPQQSQIPDELNPKPRTTESEPKIKPNTQPQIAEVKDEKVILPTQASILQDNQEIALDISKEPIITISAESHNETPAHPPPMVFSVPQPESESDDDGSELSRDSFEGNIVTNTPSPAFIKGALDEGSLASSSHSIAKSINTEKVNVISSKEEFIYEYERWQPFVQWGQSNPGHMLPSDPGIYSDLDGTKFGYNTDEVAPSHPKWWHVISPFEPVNKDEDPWEYSVDFRNYEWHPSKQKKTFVRRRKLRRLVGDSRHHQTSLSHGITSFSSSQNNMNPPPPTVKGNIKKSGGKLQSFNDRYFVLETTSEGSFLIYYMKYTDCPPFGNNERDRMNLKHCQIDISTEGHVILTSRKGKTYVLDLQDHPDQEKWIQALRDHIKYASGTGSEQSK